MMGSEGSGSRGSEKKREELRISESLGSVRRGRVGK